MFFKQFPFIPQQDQMDCGPACLAMISQKYGKKYPLQFLRDNAYYTREGVSLSGMTEAATTIGFDSVSLRLTLKRLINEAPLPCVLFWNNSHFVVLYKIRKKIFSNDFIFEIADPNSGLISVDSENFIKLWKTDDEGGIALLLEPTEKFYALEVPKKVKTSLNIFLKYLIPFKNEVVQLFLAMFIGSLFTLIFPILTQALIDKGLGIKNLNYVTIILIAQISLFIGSAVIDVVRNWIILYVGSRLNISIISDFFKKIVRLPIRFFDTKFIGDFFQRIYDHSRIEHFLTSQSLTTLFSLLNFLVLFLVLLYYNVKILIVYIVLTTVSIVWSSFFFNARERLDYFRFKTGGINHDAVNEMINGMQEIKINNFEKYMRGRWEDAQIKLFKINIEGLKLDQIQLIGFDFINQFKNIIVTFIAAREVILGNITIGGMIGITYIVGQMNNPINQLVTFLRSLQDAKLSMDRLIDVHSQDDEETPNQIPFVLQNNTLNNNNNGIDIKNVSFRYDEPQSPFVLKNINLFIPEGKTTAIVGGSGSGKTTLIKLLLKFYTPTEGIITINNCSLLDLSPTKWRENCGVVMQDGYIFSDSIERNIATNDNPINKQKLDKAIDTANIKDFVQSLSFKEKTKIGASGNGISGGQKQRILIARSVYKNPPFIFFDEATSSLDTINESIIYNNLKDFFQMRTVVVIAHRLSTVKNADQIIVLKEGEIIERGTHNELVSSKNEYFNLVKNQIELES